MYIFIFSPYILKKCVYTHTQKLRTEKKYVYNVYSKLASQFLLFFACFF